MAISFRAALLRAAGAAISAATLLVAIPANAQQVFEFAVWYSDRDFYAPMTIKWANEVEKVTEGRVKVKLHFSGSLVPAKETVSAVRNGSVGGGTTSISFIAPIVRELSYMEPFFWIPAEARAGQEMMNKLTPASRELMEKRGMALMFALPSSGLITACRREPIKDVADWKGKKVRAAGRLQGLQLTAVGAAPVAIDPGELYIALQNGTVDCTMFLSNLALSGKIYEVAPHVTYWNDGANSSFYYVNLDQWKKVSAEDQKKIIAMSDAHAQAWAIEQIDMQQNAAKELEKAGAKVFYPTREEIGAHKKAMSSVWAEIDKMVGPGGKLFSDVITKQ